MKQKYHGIYLVKCPAGHFTIYNNLKEMIVKCDNSLKIKAEDQLMDFGDDSESILLPGDIKLENIGNQKNDVLVYEVDFSVLDESLGYGNGRVKNGTLELEPLIAPNIPIRQPNIHKIIVHFANRPFQDEATSWTFESVKAFTKVPLYQTTFPQYIKSIEFYR